jgi:hypothetical protein
MYLCDDSHALVKGRPLLLTVVHLCAAPPRCRLYMLTWHVGLFLTLLLGQVGVNGRKQVRHQAITCGVCKLAVLVVTD